MLTHIGTKSSTYLSLVLLNTVRKISDNKSSISYVAVVSSLWWGVSHPKFGRRSWTTWSHETCATSAKSLASYDDSPLNLSFGVRRDCYATTSEGQDQRLSSGVGGLAMCGGSSSRISGRWRRLPGPLCSLVSPPLTSSRSSTCPTTASPRWPALAASCPWSAVSTSLTARWTRPSWTCSGRGSPCPPPATVSSFAKSTVPECHLSSSSKLASLSPLSTSGTPLYQLATPTCCSPLWPPEATSPHLVFLVIISPLHLLLCFPGFNFWWQVTALEPSQMTLTKSPIDARTQGGCKARATWLVQRKAELPPAGRASLPLPAADQLQLLLDQPKTWQSQPLQVPVVEVRRKTTLTKGVRTSQIKKMIDNLRLNSILCHNQLTSLNLSDCGLLPNHLISLLQGLVTCKRNKGVWRSSFSRL